MEIITLLLQWILVAVGLGASNQYRQMQEKVNLRIQTRGEDFW